MSSTTTALERFGTFPPVTPADWRNMMYGAPLPINGDAAQMVYDVCWFLVKDEAAAVDLTIITFRIAVSRFNDDAMPEPAGYTAWLTSIASNEAHRYLEVNPTRRMSSALLDSTPDREAYYLADTLSDLRADHKLALILRYRYETPTKYLSMALDMRPRKVARLMVKARESFNATSSVPPNTLGWIQAPRRLPLPQNVEPYTDREMRRSVLGYDWIASEFPVIPERDERRQKWVTLALTALILVAVAFLITRPWSAERPSLIDPPSVEQPLDE